MMGQASLVIRISHGSGAGAVGPARPGRAPLAKVGSTRKTVGIEVSEFDEVYSTDAERLVRV